MTRPSPYTVIIGSRLTISDAGTKPPVWVTRRTTSSADIDPVPVSGSGFPADGCGPHAVNSNSGTAAAAAQRRLMSMGRWRPPPGSRRPWHDR
jgi:hypothetical protein